MQTKAIEQLSMYERQVEDGHKLSTGKWANYCEGLEGVDKAFTAVLLENTAKYINRFDETTRVTQIGNFDKQFAV